MVDTLLAVMAAASPRVALQVAASLAVSTFSLVKMCIPVASWGPGLGEWAFVLDIILKLLGHNVKILVSLFKF